VYDIFLSVLPLDSCVVTFACTWRDIYQFLPGIALLVLIMNCYQGGTNAFNALIWATRFV